MGADMFSTTFEELPNEIVMSYKGMEVYSMVIPVYYLFTEFKLPSRRYNVMSLQGMN